MGDRLEQLSRQTSSGRRNWLSRQPWFSRRSWASRRTGLVLLGEVVALTATTALVAILQGQLNVANPSAAYLLAVVALAVVFGTRAAVAGSIAAFLLYDFLFVDPRFTLTVSSIEEWFNLALLLVVGIVCGRLAGAQRDRAREAETRERVTRALFQISRELASAQSAGPAMVAIAELLRVETRMERVWIGIAAEGSQERVAAESGPAPPANPPRVHFVLRRMPGDVPAQWVKVHAPTALPRTDPHGSPAEIALRIPVTSNGAALGSIWACRTRQLGLPERPETLVLAAAADQLGRTLERDRLVREAMSMEVARRSDALKSALLDSVSHDLRTPLASIRAAAGSLMDPTVTWSPEDERATAASIDREADRLNRLVSNILDLSRIEAGGLVAHHSAFPVEDLIPDVVERLKPILGDRPIELDIPAGLPPLDIDEVFIDQVLTNLLENTARYAGPGVAVRISACNLGDGWIQLTIEDAGAGVPADALPHLFEKFYRVPRSGEGARRGTGLGLAVVRGLVETMGGRISARPSKLGGLAMDLDLRAAA
jgi:two-component system, OmpR family, sensor histidine kinase KdpD